jgi:hypothetical protein
MLLVDEASGVSVEMEIGADAGISPRMPAIDHYPKLS